MFWRSKTAFCDFAVLGQGLGSTWPMPAITSSTTTVTGGQLQNVKKPLQVSMASSHAKQTARSPHLDMRFRCLILCMFAWKSWQLPCDLRLSPDRDYLLIWDLCHAQTWWSIILGKQMVTAALGSSVADPHHVDADPDPAFHISQWAVILKFLWAFYKL